MTKPERRKLIVKRVAAMKMSVRMKAFWKARQQESKQDLLNDDFGGLPETDTALDELPDTLVG